MDSKDLLLSIPSVGQEVWYKFEGCGLAGSLPLVAVVNRRFGISGNDRLGQGGLKTTMLLRFDSKIQEAEPQCLISSAAQTAVADNYVGLPYRRENRGITRPHRDSGKRRQ